MKDRMKLRWKEWETLTAQFLSGHGQFNAKLSQFNLVGFPMCAECGVEDTVYHVMYRCVLYADIRERTKAEYDRLGLNFEIPRNLVSSAPAAATFTNFVRELGEIRD